MRGAHNSCSYEKVPIGVPHARRVAWRDLLGHGSGRRERADRALWAANARIDRAANSRIDRGRLFDASYDLCA